MTRRLIDYGESAVLLEGHDLADVMALRPVIAEEFEQVVEIVPGARTLLLRLRAPLAETDRRRLLGLPAAPPELDEHEVTEIEVDYSGADLAEVAELLDLSPDDVVAAHTGQIWTVAFCGFAPGFGYLVGENDRLRVPRRSNPRVRVPAGRRRAGRRLFRRLSPRRPRRLAVDRADRSAAVGPDRRSSRPAATRPPGPIPGGLMIIIDQPGPLTTIQDLGRPGLAHLGVSPSGAADRTAHRLANRLVGNAGEPGHAGDHPGWLDPHRGRPGLGRGDRITDGAAGQRPAGIVALPVRPVRRATSWSSSRRPRASATTWPSAVASRSRRPWAAGRPTCCPAWVRPRWNPASGCGSATPGNGCPMSTRPRRTSRARC